MRTELAYLTRLNFIRKKVLQTDHPGRRYLLIGRILGVTNLPEIVLVFIYQDRRHLLYCFLRFVV